MLGLGYGDGVSARRCSLCYHRKSGQLNVGLSPSGVQEVAGNLVIRYDL